MADSEKKISYAIAHTGSLRPDLEDFAEFLEEFNKETHRGVALAAAAFLDDLLERILAAFLISNHSKDTLMKGVNAPLSTFSARIAACHAMGLISDEEFKNCDLIRKIRNQFAHKIKMSFKNDRVRSFCSSLALGEKSDTRAQFTTAAVTLILKLNNRAQYVSQKPLKYQEWPSSGDTGRLLW